jgi:4-amino-4-deoxy-L-arabinose transferase-like glycosyltransferase
MTHWYQDRWLWAIILIAAVLALSNLGDRHFWGDEVHLLNLGKSISQYGLPVVDDALRGIEVTYEQDDVTKSVYNEKISYGVLVNGKDVYSLHPWLVSYISSVPIALFGPHREFLIRLPFALIGLLAIPLTYALAQRIAKNRRVALLAALLLAGSVTYLLALRNANYYGLILFAVPATLLCYLRVIEREPDARWQFALAGAMLFHSQWLVFMGTMLGIAAHFLLFNRKMDSFKRVIAPLIGIFAITFPWFFLTGQFSKAGVISSPLQYALLLSISAYHFILWFMPLALLLFAPFILVQKRRVQPGFALLALTIIWSFLFVSLNYYTGTPVRYYYGLLPLAMIFNAAVIDKLWAWKRPLALVLVALLIATNWVHIAPLAPFQSTISGIAGSQDVLGTGEDAQKSFVAKTLRPRVLLGEYLHEITHPVVSPTRAIITAINSAQPKGADIYVAAGDANAIGYYTGLRPATTENNFRTRAFDWIALPVEDERNAEIREDYLRIHFPYSTERWGDTADPAHHLFATTEEWGFYLYKKK